MTLYAPKLVRDVRPLTSMLAACAVAWGGAMTGGCKKLVFKEEEVTELAREPQVVRTAGIGQGDPLPTASPVPKGVVQPITLTIIQVRPDSWWKACLFVTVNNDVTGTKAIGCNKDENLTGKSEVLQIKTGECNSLRLEMKVFKNKRPCQPGQPCNGPYDLVEDWKRSTDNQSDRDFFKVFDVRRLLPLHPSIRLTPEQEGALSQLQSEAETYSKSGMNRWLRVYFEDQSRENFTLGVANPTEWRKYGVDYNDYVVDFKGENAKFTIEGSGMGCEG